MTLSYTAPTSKRGKQKFTSIEDSELSVLVQKYGENDWNAIALQMPNRSSRQCRERWKYYLAPTAQQGFKEEWTNEEDELLMVKFHEYGPKWSFISKFFKCRTDVNVKNRFHRLSRSKPKEDIELTNSSSSANSEPVKPSKLILELPFPLSYIFSRISENEKALI